MRKDFYLEVSDELSIGQALKRSFPDMQVFVRGDEAFVGSTKCLLSRRAAKFVRDFDNGVHMLPQRFLIKATTT